MSKVADWDLPPDEQQSFGIQLANGRKVVGKVSRWKEMMFRSKRGKNMKDKEYMVNYDSRNGNKLNMQIEGKNIQFACNKQGVYMFAISNASKESLSSTKGETSK